MPAPAKYAYVPDQLRTLALDAKRRGLNFEEFWHEALPVRVCTVCEQEGLLAKCPRVTSFSIEGRVPIECAGKTKGPVPPTFAEPRKAGPEVVFWPTDAVERRAWLGGVDTAKEAWRDAYEGRPASRQHDAIVRLMRALPHFGDEGNRRDLAVA